jgi:protein-S-isoprenylcysteine O-methyltransferase Ste14
MQDRSRRRPRRRRLTAAILLAVVALTILVVASPAVAKPAPVSHAAGAQLSVAGSIAILVIAACGALALMLLAFFTGRRESAQQGVAVAKPKRMRPTARHRAAA